MLPFYRPTILNRTPDALFYSAFDGGRRTYKLRFSGDCTELKPEMSFRDGVQRRNAELEKKRAPGLDRN